jgi:hypothetical protein
MRGVSRPYLQSYLVEFYWRGSTKQTNFELFLPMFDLIGKVFPYGQDPNKILCELVSDEA